MAHECSSSLDKFLHKLDNQYTCPERKLSSPCAQFLHLPHPLQIHRLHSMIDSLGNRRVWEAVLPATSESRTKRITISTLMRVAYGEEKVGVASSQREERKRLLRTFESDLEVLNRYELKPVFDPITYPPEIQPLWAKLVDLPEDGEAALEFWMNDGSSIDSVITCRPLLYSYFTYF